MNIKILRENGSLNGQRFMIVKKPERVGDSVTCCDLCMFKNVVCGNVLCSVEDSAGLAVPSIEEFETALVVLALTGETP